jgi:uroporphyrinogen-III decarboxylase
MTPRERHIATLTFGNPDKIPFSPGGGRESTRARWHSEGVPEDRDPHVYVLEVIGLKPDPPKKPQVNLGLNERLMPQFEEKVLEHKDGHYICQDWKGNICEISDEFDITYLRNAIDFVTRRWIKCPVENRDDWEQLKTRYDVNTPGRFPDDFVERCKIAAQRDWPLEVHFSGPFWILREWCGFEGLCMMMVDDPELVDEMAAFWTDFISQLLDRIFEHVTPDMVHLSEDMAYKAKAMISMDMARRFCTPSWKAWGEKVRQAGVPLYAIDSDGYIGELIPLWIEAGVNACDPIEVAAHCDINEFRRRFGHNMAYRGGVDKRCMAKGGQALRDELKRVEPVLRDGGYIPGCDHGVPSDVSWPNFVDYCRQLAQMTGWL